MVTERYELVIPAEVYDTDNIRALLEVIASAEFKRRVDALGGYSTRHTGETLDIGD